MANTQDIRRRIRSIRNTAQITKAMQMVAASKMRRAQQHALAGRPYAALMNKVLVSLQKRTDPRFHPLLAVRPLKKELVLIISTDTGICGVFINTISQHTVVQTLLPISSFDLPKSETAQAESEGHDPMIGYVFEPNAEVVLDSMLPYYVSYQVFQMILDARASEHSARMVAMKNATDNANQFIKDLTLEYNKMRQAGITTELLEIATAQMTLGG